MKFRKNILGLVLALALVSPIFGFSADLDKNTSNSKAISEIESIIQKIDFNMETLDVETVKVHFMVNTSNEIVVLRTNSKEVDKVLKSSLNYKSLENRDLEANKVYILPITFQK